MLLLQHSVNPPILTGGGGGVEDFKFAFIGELGNFQNNQGKHLVGEGVKNDRGNTSNFTLRVLGCSILEFLELFWTFFGTGNELEKIPFFRFVLELFLNSEFLTISFLGYSIYDCPLFRSSLLMKYYFNSVKGNLNNRQNHQVTIHPNWSWMTFSKLPHLLNAL